MNTTQQDAVCLSESEMDAFEALLASDSVPDDCMSLEMLDGYLAGVILAPTPLKPVEWLPSVWSESDVDMRGSGVQKVLSLVMRYHDELVETLGDPEGWAPFFYGSDEDPDGTRLGDEWMTGFELGLSLWAEDWADDLDGHDAATFEGLIERAMAPWADDEVDAADDDTRIEWLTETATAVRAMRHLRDACGLPPVPHATAAAGAPQPKLDA